MIYWKYRYIAVDVAIYLYWYRGILWYISLYRYISFVTLACLTHISWNKSEYFLSLRIFADVFWKCQHCATVIFLSMKFVGIENSSWQLYKNYFVFIAISPSLRKKNVIDEGNAWGSRSVYLRKFEEWFFCVYLASILILSFTDLLSIGPQKKSIRSASETLKILIFWNFKTS